jgi:hypothetical protein
MAKKMWLSIIILIAAIACIFFAWELHLHTSVDSNTTPVVDKAALVHLQTDMQDITSHFIEVNRDGSQTLTPEEQKIRDDVVALFVADGNNGAEFYSNLWLDAVGTRYILATQPIAESSYDEVIDSQTGTVMTIPESARYDLSPGRNAMFYIDPQHIYLYTLDQPATTLVPGSALTGTETYNSDEADNPAIIPTGMSHTQNSITITIFDSSDRVPNPKLGVGATMNGVVREVTLTFYMRLK